MIRYRPTLINRALDAVLPLPERDWDADWRLRAPAACILGLARAALLLPTRRSNGKCADGVGVMAFFHLGDQIRMLNVLSRFGLDEIDLITNAETIAAIPLYPGVRLVQIARFHGILSLFEQGLARGRYERMLVPHPTMTMPSALCRSRRIADKTFAAATGEYSYRASNVRFVNGDRRSWRAFYESFFETTLGAIAAHDRPNVKNQFRYRSSRTDGVVCHFGASMVERSIPLSVASSILKSILDLGFRPILVGSAAEREPLSKIASETSARVVCGASIPEVASLMAHSRAFVGVDSSMMNLSDAVGLPSVVLYSSTRPDVHGPFYTATRSVQVCPPTVGSVMVLTGRIRRPTPDWSLADQSVARALKELTNR